MKTKYQDTTRREEALEVLKTLARRIRSINADLVYVSLIESGFSEDETTRLTGALFRTAKARGWLTKTDFSIKLVQMVHAKGGRFLAKDPADELWYEVDFKLARRKASQALREETRQEREYRMSREANDEDEYEYY